MLPTPVPTADVYRGDSAVLVSYILKDADGNPRDLTAYTDWAAQWRSTADSAVALDLTVETDQLADGKFVVTAPGAVTADMPGDGVWDVEATHPIDGPRTFARGRTSLTQDVTRV